MTNRDAVARRRQLAALRAYIRTGSMKAAAHELGITESGIRRRIAAYCRETGTTLPAAIYELGRTERAQIVRPERGSGFSGLT